MRRLWKAHPIYWVTLLLTIALTMEIPKPRPVYAQTGVQQTISIALTTTARTLLLAGTSGRQTMVNDIALSVGTGGATGATWEFVSCTSANCASGITSLSGAMSSATSGNPFVMTGNPAIAVPTGADLYIREYSAVTIGGFITAVQQ